MYSAEQALRDKQDIIKELKGLRKRFDRLRKKGMSVLRFAIKYGYSESHLCHQMAGRRGATRQYLERLKADLEKEGA